MKKRIICLILIICFFPIHVKAEIITAEDIQKHFKNQIVVDSVWTVVIAYTVYKIYNAQKLQVRSAKISAGKAKNIAKHTKNKKLKEKEMKALEEMVIKTIEKVKSAQ